MNWDPDDEGDDEVMAGIGEDTEVIDTEGTTQATRVEPAPAADVPAVRSSLRVRPLSASMARRSHVVSVLVTTTHGQVLYHRGVR